MIPGVLLFLLLTLTFPAYAAPIVVTAGEHDGFTRLVVTLPEAGEWSLGRTADGYRLTLPGAKPEIDLSRVGDRIGRSRLAEVTQIMGSADLRIVMACACHATAFAFRPNIIVIDVKSGPAPDDSPFEIAVTPDQTPRDPPPAAIAGGTALAWDRRVMAQRPSSLPHLQPAISPQLAREIGAAASAGMVEVQPEIPASHAQPPQIALHTSPNIGLRIGDQPRDQLLQPECPAPDLVQPENWLPQPGDATRFPRQIAEFLAEEAEELLPQQLEAAAKIYLFYGFGAEARQLLSLLTEPRAEHDQLRAISFILDQENVSPNPFAGFEHCQSAIGLWAVLAQAHLRPSQPIASDAIYQAFVTLPRHLRILLVGPLMDRLREQQDNRIADRLRATIERETGSPNPDFDLALGRLQMAQQDNALARDSLEKAAAAPGLSEAEALISLAHLALESGAELSTARLQTLAALEAQYSAEPLGARLREALIIAYGLAGEFTQAGALLSRTPDADPLFWRLLAEHGKPRDILDLAFAPPAHADSLTTADQRFLIANHLADLGFDAQVVKWLTVVGATDQLPEAHRLLLAEAYLGLHQPRETLKVLAGTSLGPGPKGADLRSRALIALDRQNEAAALFADQPVSAAVSHLQRREGNWASVAATDTAIWARAAKLITPPARPAGATVTLAEANDSLTATLETRAAIAALLDATARPAAPSPEGAE